LLKKKIFSDLVLESSALSTPMASKQVFRWRKTEPSRTWNLKKNEMELFSCRGPLSRCSVGFAKWLGLEMGPYPSVCEFFKGFFKLKKYCIFAPRKISKLIEISEQNTNSKLAWMCNLKLVRITWWPESWVRGPPCSSRCEPWPPLTTTTKTRSCAFRRSANSPEEKIDKMRRRIDKMRATRQTMTRMSGSAVSSPLGGNGLGLVDCENESGRIEWTCFRFLKIDRWKLLLIIYWK
jgi:hypothetical protein